MFQNKISMFQSNLLIKAARGLWLCGEINIYIILLQQILFHVKVQSNMIKKVYLSKLSEQGIRLII